MYEEENPRSTRHATINKIVVHPGLGFEMGDPQIGMVQRRPYEMLDSGLFGCVHHIFTLLLFSVKCGPVYFHQSI